MKILKLNLLLAGILLLGFSSQAQDQKKPVLFGKGINFTAADESFTCKFNYRFQQLLVVNYDEATDEYTNQFLVRRSRLKFGGYAFSPKVTYKGELGLTNRDISINKEDGNTRDAARIILDAVLKWEFANNTYLWVGQTKLPGNRERVISSANLQFVDRSLVNSRFNIDRDAGLQLRGKYKLGDIILLPTVALSQGEGRNSTALNYGGLDYTAHLDILPLGAFAVKKDDYNSSDLSRNPKPRVSFGFTYDYNDGSVRQGGQLGSYVYLQDTAGENTVYAENSLTTYMVDMMFKYKGFSILAEYANKTAADDIENLSSGYLTGSGITAQAGYLMNKDFEVAFRYTNVEKDNDFSAVNDETQYTLGISKYVVGHSLKFQSDITRREFPGVDDAKYMFRMQVEMQF